MKKGSEGVRGSEEDGGRMREGHRDKCREEGNQGRIVEGGREGVRERWR